MAYRLTEAAELDLVRMFRDGAAMFGLRQAERYYMTVEERFAFLAANPRAARERLEIDPPVRVHPFKSHLILYRIEDSDIVIIGVRHGHEDWQESKFLRE